MSEQIGTVSMLLGLDPKAASDHRLEPGEMLDVARRIAGVLRGKLPVRHLPRASAETLAALGGLLSKSVLGCLTEAWNKRAEFRKFADPAQYPPEKTASVALYPHTVKWTYRPTVEILLNGKAVTKLPFVVELDFKLEGAELVVQGGKLMRLVTGKSTVTAKLNYHAVMLHTRTLDDRALPGEIRFGDGVAIPAFSSPVPRPPSLPTTAPRAAESVAEAR